MAEKLGDAFVDLRAPTTGLGGDFARAEGMFGSFGARMKSMALSVAGAIGVAWGTRAIVGVLRDSIREAASAERALAGLTTALGMQGEKARSMLPDLVAYARWVHNTTLYTDDEIVALMRLATNLGIGADRLKMVTQAAIGLAAALDLPLQSAMEMIVRAGMGYDRQLKMIGVALDDNMSAEEKMAFLMQKGIGLYGQATEATKTHYGAQVQAKKAWAEAKEELGRASVEYFNLQRGIENVTRVLDHLSDKEKGVGHDTLILKGATSALFQGMMEGALDVSHATAEISEAQKLAQQAAAEAHAARIRDVLAGGALVEAMIAKEKQVYIAQAAMKKYVAGLPDIKREKFGVSFGDVEATWRMSQSRVMEGMQTNADKRIVALEEMQAEAIKDMAAELAAVHGLDKEAVTALEEVAAHTKKIAEWKAAGVYGPTP